MTTIVCKRKWLFTEEMDETIRAMWKSQIPERVRILSENWDYPKDAIKNRAKALGVIHSHKLSDEEKKIILQHKDTSINKIRKILKSKGHKRSWVTINTFLLKYNRFMDDTEFYSIEDVMGGFGVSRYVVSRWIKKGYLIEWDETGPNNIKMFSYKSIRKFIKNHYSIINFATLEEHGFKTWFMEFLLTNGQKVPSERDILDQISNN